MLVRIHGIPFLAAILVVVLVAAACGGGEEAPPTAPAPTSTSVSGVVPTPTTVPVTIDVEALGCETPEGFVKAEKAICNMIELNNSGQFGTATFTQVERDTEVVIDISPGSSENDPQPAAVHDGTCDNLRSARWELEGVVGGMSTSLIKDIPFSLIQFSKHAVAVFKSEAENDVLVACGNLPRAFGE